MSRELELAYFLSNKKVVSHVYLSQIQREKRRQLRMVEKEIKDDTKKKMAHAAHYLHQFALPASLFATLASSCFHVPSTASGGLCV
jgi:organic hydroperoxide reductase OsmC/OhrA